MRIVLETPRGERELAIDAHAPDVTVAEVLAAADCAPVPDVHVGGRRVTTATTLTALSSGAVVSLFQQPTTQPRRGAGPAPRLEVVAGPGAGASAVLDRPLLIGAAPGCDLVVPGRGVAAQHCRVRPHGADGAVITPLSDGALWVDGAHVPAAGSVLSLGSVVRLGATVLRLAPPPSDGVPHAAAAPTARRGFNRPPRAGPPPPIAAVSVPAPPRPPSTPPPLSLVALLVPVALAAGLVVTLGSWRYAVFLLLGPALLLATTLSGRRRARRTARRDRAAHRADVDRFADELRAAAAAARARRWEIHPSVAEVVRRATLPSTRLWERRTSHDDALVLTAGVGTAPWTPPLDEPPARPDASLDAVLDRFRALDDQPVPVTLADGGVVGIVGARDQAVAVARSLLVQACVHHGPADVAVAVLAGSDRLGDWNWTGWLPHVRAGGGRRRQACGSAAAVALAEEFAADGSDRVRLTVIDDPDLLHGDRRVLDPWLPHNDPRAAAIVVAETVDQLPASCAAVLEVSDDGRGRLVRPAERIVLDAIDLAGLSTATCRRVARHLGMLRDPELADVAAELPTRVDLLELLDTAATVTWDERPDAGDLSFLLGVGPDGPLLVDLVADGPHALLAGTTGAGKSELLRSLVAGLAARYDPERCTFVLVDYKGGAAFDACADLPHVVGVVTDLDEQLGERALRCLEAELLHRERRLRAAGVSDLVAWSRLPAAAREEPLPRLVVVVDEFATLRDELPGFVRSLVGIAQRGRSLGVHLVLGTQRPAGAVDDDVRANVALRIALRTTDPGDSQDVVGVDDAADISAATPGRGLVRVGPAAPVPFQAALVSGTTGAETPRVRVGPVRFGMTDLPARPAASASGVTDLHRLVRACQDAWASRGLPAPRRPWPPPLPHTVSFEDLGTAPGADVDGQQEVADEVGTELPVGLLDDPDNQRQVAAGWNPGRGNLLVLGAVGSGTTTTLATVALAAARRHHPDDLHLHVLDLGRGELLPLRDLPHCGAVVTAREPARRERLQRLLLDEAAWRRRLDRAALAALPLHVVVVDGLPAWLDELDEPDRLRMLDAVHRLIIDAPDLRMAVVASATRPGAVRSTVLGAIEQRIVHRLADPNDLALLGLRPSVVPSLPPGRAVRPDGLLLQVARPASLMASVAAVAGRWSTPSRPPAPVLSLPAAVTPAQLAPEVDLGTGVWHLPVGLDALTLLPVAWRLPVGDHALVLGPAASGRSRLLRGLAALAAPQVRVVAVTRQAEDWPARCEVQPSAALSDVLAGAEATGTATLVLVDDAGPLPDPGAVLDRLAHAASHVHVVAAARPVDLQRDYGHWLRRIAASGTGVLLRPTAGDAAGDLLGVRIPRRTPVAAGPGRGWSVEAGTATFVQAVSGTG